MVKSEDIPHIMATYIDTDVIFLCISWTDSALIS